MHEIHPAARRALPAQVPEVLSRRLPRPGYIGLERDYKWQAHLRWYQFLAHESYRQLLRQGQYGQIATHAVKTESRTNLLFSFEKMALRDALKSAAGSRTFAEGLYDFLYGEGAPEQRFERWCAAVRQGSDEYEE